MRETVTRLDYETQDVKQVQSLRATKRQIPKKAC
jgi:hypothetical protein